MTDRSIKNFFGYRAKRLIAFVLYEVDDRHEITESNTKYTVLSKWCYAKGIRLPTPSLHAVSLGDAVEKHLSAAEVAPFKEFILHSALGVINHVWEAAHIKIIGPIA